MRDAVKLEYASAETTLPKIPIFVYIVGYLTVTLLAVLGTVAWLIALMAVSSGAGLAFLIPTIILTVIVWMLGSVVYRAVEKRDPQALVLFCCGSGAIGIGIGIAAGVFAANLLLFATASFTSYRFAAFAVCLTSATILIAAAVQCERYRQRLQRVSIEREDEARDYAG